ncbi:uncharacterized protein LOC134797254 isoform X2 [Cydia splendana]|uniref:uncharacterized protein LOC134797254 isoform X2 n=1 Tax=Cydia splendana TaxID=1100963 RepID=UPI00300D8C69
MQCLECYICDNCPKTKLDEIQTCGPTTITELSTTTTESPATTTVTTKLPTPSTTLILTTEAISEFTTISSTIPTEAITTSTTTEAATTTETRPTSTESTNPNVASSTATYLSLVPTNTPMISPADDITSSTVTTITISDFPSTVTEFQQITTPTEASISSALLTTNITDATTSSKTTSMYPTILKETIAEPVISTIATKKDPGPTDNTVSFISTLLTTEVPLATFPVTEPTIQTFSKLPTLTEQNMESTIQNIPALALAQPISTFTKSAPNISLDAAIYPESTVNNIRPDKEENVPYRSRRMRSSSEACACKIGEKCDCLTHQRTKRYTLRGLGLSKEAVKYVCFVDKYKVNETEIVKRGCAIKEADEKTLCTKLGFGGDCKICDTHQCNGAAIIQASILLMFSLLFI